MQFTTSLLFSALAAVAAASNAFTFSTLVSVPVGKPFSITWGASTDGTVTLLLKNGPSTALVTVETIASKILNQGLYIWTPEASLVGPGLTSVPYFAFEIVNDLNTTDVNYSNQFSITTDSASTASGSVSPVAPITTGSSAQSIAATSTKVTSVSTSVSLVSTSAKASSSSTLIAVSSGNSTATGKTSTSVTGSVVVTPTKSATTSASASSTSSASGAKALKVGGGLLAAVGAALAVL